MRYLVAVDGWEPSERALEFAVAEADESGSHVDVVHVVDEDGGDPESNERIREVIESVVGGKGVDYEVHFLETDKRTKPAAKVGQRILEFVDEAGVDLVFIGNEETGRAERMIVGSVARQLIEARTVPVTLVP
jgi:nucleotide-binding universal stress UspA family protein